jgi:pimeloyl-ACP methyl ester carboxylesterase
LCGCGAAICWRFFLLNFSVLNVIIARTVAAATVIMSAVGCAPPGPRTATAGLQDLRSTLSVGAPLEAKISYLKSKNAGAVAVIWVHGTPGSAEAWSDYVQEPLASTVSVALDRPGFGQSEPQAAVTSLEQQAAALAALFPPAPQTVVLVGHSLGGAVVAYAAARYPERVRALVLLASSLDPAQEAIHPMQYVGRVWPLSSMLPRALRNANEELMGFKHQLQLLEPMLPSITAPTIIVHGTKDELVPFANVAYMQSHLTGVRSLETVVLEGQNHFLPWNSEATVRKAVAWAVTQANTPSAGR